MQNSPDSSKFSDLSRQKWDAVVAGAGLAGATLAICLGRAGQRVLLLDRARFPRSKTCGGTLNPRSVEILERLGLAEVLTKNDANLIRGVKWRTGPCESAMIRFRDDQKAFAISREKLDVALIHRATNQGVVFVGGIRCIGTLEENRIIYTRVLSHEGEILIPSNFVAACDGLGSMLATDAGLSLPAKPGPGDYIGASCITGQSMEIPDDIIVMAIGKDGYVGIVKVEDEFFNIASAIRLDRVGGGVKPADRSRKILESVGIDLPEEVTNHVWDHSKPVLKRRVSSVAKSRLLLAGDAAGYQEPVTGEGMAWALESVEYLSHALQNGWTPEVSDNWEKEWKRLTRRRWLVKLAGGIVRSPAASKGAVAVLNSVPVIGNFVGSCLGRDVRSCFTNAES